MTNPQESKTLEELPMLTLPELVCFCPVCKTSMAPYTKNVQETEYKDVYGHVLRFEWRQRTVVEGKE
jgi:hypothetical protein